MTSAAVDRLARGVHLDAERIDTETWRVTGGHRPHTVTPAGCDCMDATLHGAKQPCKHLLAVRLRTGHAETLKALRAIVPVPSRKARPRSSGNKLR